MAYVLPNIDDVTKRRKLQEQEEEIERQREALYDLAKSNGHQIAATAHDYSSYCPDGFMIPPTKYDVERYGVNKPNFGLIEKDCMVTRVVYQNGAEMDVNLTLSEYGIVGYDSEICPELYLIEAATDMWKSQLVETPLWELRTFLAEEISEEIHEGVPFFWACEWLNSTNYDVESIKCWLRGGIWAPDDAIRYEKCGITAQEFGTVVDKTTGRTIGDIILESEMPMDEAVDHALGFLGLKSNVFSKIVSEKEAESLWNLKSGEIRRHNKYHRNTLLGRIKEIDNTIIIHVDAMIDMYGEPKNFK